MIFGGSLNFKIGDKVIHTDEVKTGTVSDIKQDLYVTVEWDNGSISRYNPDGTISTGFVFIRHVTPLERLL